jgi:hypothetical protein
MYPSRATAVQRDACSGLHRNKQSSKNGLWYGLSWLVTSSATSHLGRPGRWLGIARNVRTGPPAYATHFNLCARRFRTFISNFSAGLACYHVCCRRAGRSSALESGCQQPKTCTTRRTYDVPPIMQSMNVTVTCSVSDWIHHVSEPETAPGTGTGPDALSAVKFTRKLPSTRASSTGACSEPHENGEAATMLIFRQRCRICHCLYHDR